MLVSATGWSICLNPGINESESHTSNTKGDNALKENIAPPAGTIQKGPKGPIKHVEEVTPIFTALDPVALWLWGISHRRAATRRLGSHSNGRQILRKPGHNTVDDTQKGAAVLSAQYARVCPRACRWF